MRFPKGWVKPGQTPMSVLQEVPEKGGFENDKTRRRGRVLHFTLLRLPLRVVALGFYQLKPTPMLYR